MTALWRAFLALALILPVSSPPAMASELALPHPQHLRLSNGLEVLLVERHDLPLVTADLVFRTGAVDEPTDQPGLADMTVDLLRRGSTSQGAAAIADELDALGASFDVNAGPERTDFTLTMLKADLDPVTGLLGDVLTHPAFDASEFAKLQEMAIAGTRGAVDDPAHMQQVAVARALYGDTAYGRAAAFRLSELTALRLADVKAFYRDHFQVDRAFLVLVGDLTPSDVERHLGPALAKWQTPASPPRISQPIVPTGWHGAQLVGMDLTQANVTVAFPAIARTDSDYYALLVTTQILGGGYLSRLYKEVREERGLAYSVDATNALRPKTGATLITLQTRLESISEALKVVLDQVDDLRAHPVSPGELAAIKRYYAGRLPRDLESNQDLADEVSEMTFYRLGDDYLDHFLARIQAVTSADVQRVARRYFAPEHRIVSVVGPETVKPAIIPYGPLRELTRAELIR